MYRTSLRTVIAGCVAAVTLTSISGADDWPVYKKDAARSSVSVEDLSFPLAEHWTYRPHRPPSPAWPEPGKELNRTDFDYAFQPIVAEGLIYFGSSADDTVRALDIETGRSTWRFITSGPVRFAPTFARGKLYVASDDGILYCLDAASGKPLWQFALVPDSDRMIGNGRLIARYPCRTGPLVVDDVLYVTAGMWPTEGVYIYALDADTGREIWCNDSSGNIYADLPHAFANGFGGVAPQGYLVVSGDVLIVPTGRSVPAAFDRHTGRLLHYKPEKTHYHGASYGGGVCCTAYGDLYFNTNNRSQNPSEAFSGEADPTSQDGTIVYPLATGDQLCHIPGSYRVLVSDGTVYAAGNGRLEAINLKTIRREPRIESGDAVWRTTHSPRVYCLAMAGKTLLTGNRDSIAAFNASDGEPVWSVELKDRRIRGLAIADGRLVAAAHTGEVICFAPHGHAGPSTNVVGEGPRPAKLSNQDIGRAEDVVQRSGKKNGYALVVGEPDTKLAEALARATDLHVVCLVNRPDLATRQRAHLLDAGLLGSRISVHLTDNPAKSGLPSYFADLVVVSAVADEILPAECYRSLRPCGGTLCLLEHGENARRKFVSRADIPPAEVQEALFVRGMLPGAGDWRYPWADGGRRGIGSESRVRFPLQLLWFGGPGPGRLLDRHLMPSPPISVAGRVFLQGQNHVLAFDAYNGRELWSRHIEEAGRKYSQYYSASLVADDDAVYVVQHDKCLALDQASGKTLRTYGIPESVVRGTGRPRLPTYLDVEWPDTWTITGPSPQGRPESHELKAVQNILDFTQLFGGYGFKPLEPGQEPAARPQRGKQFSYHDVGRTCFASAKIDCPTDGKLLIGAGADWGMRWYLDGKIVFSDPRDDSSSRRRGFYSRDICSPEDRVFDVDVTAGEHELKVEVTAGSRGWALASASMAGREKELMPIAVHENPNVPNLRDLDWGYLSVTDDLLLGSYNVPVSAGQPAESHLLWRSESKALVAFDKRDGSLRWTYRPRPDRIVANIEIAHGDGRLFLIDGTSKADLVRARRRNETIEAELTLVALDLEDGSEIWRQDDVPMLGDRNVLSRLKTNISHLFMGQPSWGHLVYADDVVLYGANAAFDASTGKKLWQKSTPPGKLPVVYGDRIITSENAFHLRTGEQCMAEDILTGQSVPWRYTRAYGCGPVAGCENLLFFRSGADGFFDMNADGTTTFGGVRSGCARTLLAANGLLIHPQGYSGCGCCYNFKSNLALVSAPDRNDTWYVFPRRASTGPMKRVAVNFGAPGDRRDGGGDAWLGFPRPMLESACPASVSLAMSDARCDYRRRQTSAIQGTASPGLYSSALSGQGRIAVDLSFNPEIALPTQDDSPAVDGRLNDACWQDVKTVPFLNTPFSMLAAGIDFRIFRNDQNVYFAYRGPLVGGKKLPGTRDALEIYLTDLPKRTGIHVVVGPDEKPTATFGTVGTSRRIDPEWKGRWQSAVHKTPGAWTAEVAVPVETLTDSGLDPAQLRLNCMAQARTASGFETVYLTDPLYGTKFRSCVGFHRLVPAATSPPAERSFTVRLHFAELDDVAPGERVFDIALQGETVLDNLDIAKESGGMNTALVKEIRGVKADAQILIDLIPVSPELPPTLTALEIIEQDD